MFSSLASRNTKIKRCPVGVVNFSQQKYRYMGVTYSVKPGSLLLDSGVPIFSDGLIYMKFNLPSI